MKTIPTATAKQSNAAISVIINALLPIVFLIFRSFKMMFMKNLHIFLL